MFQRERRTTGRSAKRNRFAAALVMAAAAASLARAQNVVVAPATPSLAQMRRDFRDPPAPARLRCYWWWLNGHTDKPTITHDLEQMRAKGFGGALLVDANGSNQVGNENVPPGPTFGSPAWVELYTHALREADRLGLEITLNITSGWNLGGPDVRPEDASKVLTWSRTTVSGGSPAKLQLPAPPARNGFYRSIAVLAYPLHASAEPQKDRSLRFRAAADETGFSMPDASGMLIAPPNAKPDSAVSEVIDLTGKVSADGSLQWQPPAGGAWEVLRVGYTDSDARVSTASGAWQGLAIDYLSRAAFDTYWDHTVEPLLTAAKPFHSLRYLASDSWELGGTNWTGDFAAEFRKRRGYDPVPWLPVVAGRVLGSSDQSTRFLADLRRTVADLVSANHYDRFAERAAEHGLGVQAESGGPHGAPIDALETFRHAAVPQTEFWSENGHRSKDPERFFNKEAASAANIYGQRFVAAEGETSIGPQWSESLAADLKPSFDMAVTEGMNRLVWHEFTSSPADTGLPGQEYFAGTHLNPKVTWWNAGDAFFTYLNRVQYLMQQGTPANDVLYFYGDNAPAFVRLKADDPAHVLPGYDYDVTDQDALLRTLHVQDGQLTGPSGVRWRALVLPANGRISLAALRQVQSDLRAGATVIGPAPASPTGLATPQQTAEFASIVHEVWGDTCQRGIAHAYGSGQVYCTPRAANDATDAKTETRAALAAMHLLPDAVAETPGDGPVAAYTSDFDYVHRRIGEADVYFVRNGSDHAVSRPVLLRTTNPGAELWDAVTGDIAPLHTEPSGDGRTRVLLSLPAYGSAALVLSPDAARPAMQESAQCKDVPLRTTWTVRFEPGLGATAEPVTVTDLTSWTGWPQSGVHNFSGTATYTAQVQAPSFARGQRVYLHFADVREIARFRVNGHDAGTLWAQPHDLRVDPWLKPGTNSIEIQVTNLWINRLLGDRTLPAAKRTTQTNIRAIAPNAVPLPSGLIGPASWSIRR